ncbi:MAG: tetratricopeptide repeat protein, partial [Myxococcota bacterium]
PGVSATLHQLAGVLQAQGDLSGARDHLVQSLAMDRRLYGTDDHPGLVVTLANLAHVQWAQGERTEAVATMRYALAASARVYGGTDNLYYATREVSLGFWLLELRQVAEALPLLRHGHAILQRDQPHHPYVAQLNALFARVAEYAGEANATLPGAPMGPYVAHACAVAGPLREDHLRSLTLRIVLRGAAGPAASVLATADAQAPTPGQLLTHPRQLPRPEACPIPAENWPNLLEQVATLLDSARSDFEALLPHLPRNENLQVTLPRLPEPDDDDRWALVDETTVALARAQDPGHAAAWAAALPLWLRGAQAFASLVPGDEGLALARGILSRLPAADRSQAIQALGLDAPQSKALERQLAN